MGKQWFLAAGTLLAAFLVASASVLALPLVHKDPGWPLMTPGMSAGQGSSKKELMSAKPRVTSSAGPSASTERTGTLLPGVSKDHKPPLALSSDLDALLDQPAPSGTPGASGRVTSGLAPAAQAKPEAPRTLKSLPALPGAAAAAVAGASGLLTLLVTSTLPSSQLSSLSAPPPPSLSPPLTPASLPSSPPASSISSHTLFPPGSLPRQSPSPPSLSLLPLSLVISASNSSSSPSLSRSSSLWSRSPSPLPLQSPFQWPAPSPLQIPAPVSPLTAIAGMPPDTSASVFPPTATDFLINVPGLASASLKTSSLVTEPTLPQWAVQSQPVLPPSPAPVSALSLGCTSRLPSALSTSGFLRVPESPSPRVADSTQSSTLLDPGQAVDSLQDSAASSPGPSHVFRSVTFRISRAAFSAALQNPASLEHQLLSKKVRDQLEPVYHDAFPSFEGIGVLVFRSSSGRRPRSVTVNASLVFGDHAPGPTPCQILWTLYRKLKTTSQMLGNLSLAVNSLASAGTTLTNLAQEIVSIRFVAMQPFVSQFLVPGSAAFALLEEQTLQKNYPQVTPVVSGFYEVHPQEDPLLLFSNETQWVDVYIEYKFPAPVPLHLRGLANQLAQKVLDSTLQKSSIVANGEQVELVLHKVLLQVLGRPFTEALRDKTSAESQELRGRLTRGLTTILRRLQSLAQVVVEEFQPDPLTARVVTAFFSDAPAVNHVQDCVQQGLQALWEAEGLLVQMVIPHLGTSSSGALGQRGTSIPSYVVAPVVLGLPFMMLTFILVLKWKACSRVLSLRDRKSLPWSSSA